MGGPFRSEIMLIIAQASTDWLGGDLFVTLAVIGLAIFGWRQGVFVATLAGLQVLASFIASMALLSFGLDVLRSAGIAPRGWVLAIVHVTTFLACVIGLRLAIGKYVPEMAMPFGTFIDGLLGTFVGGFAGMLLSGALLVSWSLASLPGAFRFTSDDLTFDPGGLLLQTLVRCVAVDEATRKELLHGNGGLPRPEKPRCSEPFVDVDRNGMHDKGEPFIDIDENGQFTPRVGFRGSDQDRRRHLGLLECYQLGAWADITVCHAPEITSATSAHLSSAPTIREPIYQATSTDVDGSDNLVYSLRFLDETDRGDETSEGMEIPTAIDAQTGSVTLVDEPDEAGRRAVVFTVVVTDGTGLSDERIVKVSW